MNQKKIILAAVLSIMITALLFAVVSFMPQKEKNLHKLRYSTPASQPNSIQNSKIKEGLDEKSDRLVSRQLVAPLSRFLNVGLCSEGKSCCKAGLAYNILEKPSRAYPYFSGEVKICKKDKSFIVCEFRLDESKNCLEIFDEKEKSYVSLNLWMENIENHNFHLFNQPNSLLYYLK